MLVVVKVVMEIFICPSFFSLSPEHPVVVEIVLVGLCLMHHTSKRDIPCNGNRGRSRTSTRATIKDRDHATTVGHSVIRQ